MIFMATFLRVYYLKPYGKFNVKKVVKTRVQYYNKIQSASILTQERHGFQL